MSGADDRCWYEALRERYRPTRLRVLLIAESPPDPGAGIRRFFYSRELTFDNLYRGVAQALYRERSDVDLSDKPAVLDRLRAVGLWLIDAVDEPVNRLASGERAQAIRRAIPSLVERTVELAPELGVIVCHGKVYAAAAPALRAAGLEVLHDEALPFPLGNWRERFVDGFRRALVSTLPASRAARLKAVLAGDDATTTWMARPVREVDGRTLLDLILAGDEQDMAGLAGD